MTLAQGHSDVLAPAVTGGRPSKSRPYFFVHIIDANEEIR